MLMRWSRRGVNMMVFGVFLFLTAAISRGDLHADEYELPYMLEFDGSGDRVRLDGAQDGFQHFLEGRGSILIRLNPAEILTGGANSRQFAISAGGEITGSHRDLNIGISEGGNWYLVFSDGSEYKIAATGIRPAPEANNWYNVSVVFGGDDRGFYVDGEKLESWEEFSGNTGAWRHDFHIGYSPDRDRDWPGAISDVRFFDRNLSASEIREFMEAESLSGEEDGLVGYWPLDELEGEGAYDRSGNENHGTVLGAEWSIDETRVLAEQPVKVLPSLVEAINEHDVVDIRKQALGVVRELDMAAEDISPVLLDVLNNTEQPGDVRVEAAGILIREDVDEKEAVFAVLKGILNQPEYRQEAITLLNEIDSEEAQALLEGVVEDLVKELGDEDPGVRRQAVQQLAEVGSAAEQAVPEIKVRLDDENEKVMEAAMETLRKIDITAFDRIEKEIEVVPVWSGFPVAMGFYTHKNHQFLAFYDADRRMTVASRTLDSEDWEFVKLPETLGWDSHNEVRIAVDSEGYLHVAGNMHNDPLKYFRSKRPLDIHSLERVPSMTGSDERSVTYPIFMSFPEDDLFVFEYREGSSGSGRQVHNVYDIETREWSRLLDTPLFDGSAHSMNAYHRGPARGEDGYFHVVFGWRNTPCVATNHSPSHIRSQDLKNWENAAGDPLELPVTPDTEGVVIDSSGPDSGLLNSPWSPGFDAENRLIIPYHKYDGEGNSQVFNARWEDDRWEIYQITNLDKQWEFRGWGTGPTLPQSELTSVGASPVRTEPDGRLKQDYQYKVRGDDAPVRRTIQLDPETLEPNDDKPAIPQLPEVLEIVESDFSHHDGMRVRIGGDQGDDGNPQTRYIMRWESLTSNRDRPYPKPWPEPSMLRVYKITD